MILPGKSSQEAQNAAFSSLNNALRMGSGRGYAVAPADHRTEFPHNQLEMSLESSFFDGSSFIEDGGGKALVNMSTQNLEELLQADDVDPSRIIPQNTQQWLCNDPDAFLIKRNSVGQPIHPHNNENQVGTESSNA